MTLILALEHRGKVHMIGDRISVDSSDAARVVRDAKVFRSGEWLLGVAGCWRAMSLLKFKLRAPKISAADDVDRAVNVELVDSIRSLFTSEGYAKEAAEAGETEWQLLAGLRGKLYFVDSEFSVWRSADGMDGAGHTVAIAAGTAALSAQRPINRPEKALRKAAQIAADGCSAIRGPFDYLTT